MKLFQNASGLQKKKDGGGKSTHDPCPPDSLRGICYLLKHASCVGHSSEGALLARKAGTPATLIRTRGGPKPALQTNRSCQLQRWRERRALGGRGGGLSQAESEAMEAPQHIVAASGRSTCDEARALPHSPNIHPSHRSEKDRLPLKRGRLGQETAHHTHPARPVAFGRLSPGTALSLAQR